MSSLALTSGWYYICTSYCTPDTERLWTSTELDIAKMLKGKSLFAISLLGTTIQDGGMKERSNVALEYLMFIGLQPILIRTNN